MELKVTSLKTLKEYSKGQVVKFPDFAEGQPFVARIRRPSLLELAKSGKIPNRLLNTANSLFMGTSTPSKGNKGNQFLEEILGVLEVICESCFVEPSYSDLQEAGIKLTDEQMMFIFNYTQQGVKALDSFRGESSNNPHTGDVPEV